MVGRELSARYPERERVIGEELLSVKGLKGEYSALRDVSLSLRSGEVLGIAGLDGSGRTEVLDALFGRATRSSGEIFLRGRRIQNRTPREAIASGFAYVTEERRRSGIFGILSVEANTVISTLKYYRRALLLSEKRTENAAKNEMRRLRVKAPNEKTKISTLSGGNQQKVIFSRWMLTKPTVLLLDEPTRGIDVLAKYEIYEIIGELARSGRGVIMVSSEMPELLGVCDRILVMSGGRLAGELTPDASQEQIMELATRYV
jgi:methyl-galactoside transport system ATP-binding protein